MAEDILNTPQLKAAFLETDRQVRIQNSKIGCWLAIVLMPAGMSLDYFVYPEHLLYFLKLRLLCSLLVFGVWLLFSTGIGLKYYRVLGMVWFLLPAASIAWMVYATQGAMSPYYAGLNIVLIAVGAMLPWTYQENLLAGLLVMGLWLWACVAAGPFTVQGHFFNNFYFLLLTDVIVVTGSYFSERLRKREFALRFQLDENKKALEETNRRLVELDQMKSRFFANISHELRTPLTLLISPLESIQSDKAASFDEETRIVFKTMESNALRLLKLINDLLDLVKLESGQITVRKEPIEMPGFVRGVIQSVQSVAKDKRVQLVSVVDDGLGVVMVDRDKLEKILLNLVFNALKFTSAGGKVELQARGEDSALTFRVTDTGMGIEERDLPYIFDRFWQADSSAQRKYQGTGIGLALVKELTEAQGGTVRAQSQAGKGTTMTVKLPFERPKTDGSDGPVSAGGMRASTPSAEEWLTKLYRRAELFPAITPLSETVRPDEFTRSRKPKILVADDEPDMLRFLHSQLAKHYEVLEAVDGNQAVEKTRQYLPDLVILDMMMPEKDGVEACLEIKGNLSTQSIPVILLTARADEETKMESLRSGASDFLTKPFSTTELHVRVKNLVDSHRYQRELARQKIALESTLEQLKETESELVQSEKMASLGRLSAGLIHEINNPLNYVGSALHFLQMKKDRIPEQDRAQYNEVVDDITEGIRRVQHIVSDLRSFTHPKSGGSDLIELSDVVATSLRFLSHEIKGEFEVDVQVPAEQTIFADRNKLIQVLTNLVQNSSDALREKKFAEGAPRLSLSSREENGRVRITLRDNGTGISKENMDKIFDPFFTTKDVGKGMGLGLSVCYRIVHDLGGEITVKSELGEYTEFILDLPSKG